MEWFVGEKIRIENNNKFDFIKKSENVVLIWNPLHEIYHSKTLREKSVIIQCTTNKSLKVLP